MSLFTSEYLAARIAQLHSGLINEVEFLTSLQATPETCASLCEFNSLDAETQDWNFTLDAWNRWRRVGVSVISTTEKKGI